MTDPFDRPQPPYTHRQVSYDAEGNRKVVYRLSDTDRMLKKFFADEREFVAKDRAFRRFAIGAVIFVFALGIADGILRSMGVLPL